MIVDFYVWLEYQESLYLYDVVVYVSKGVFGGFGSGDCV